MVARLAMVNTWQLETTLTLVPEVIVLEIRGKYENLSQGICPSGEGSRPASENH